MAYDPLQFLRKYAEFRAERDGHEDIALASCITMLEAEFARREIPAVAVGGTERAALLKLTNLAGHYPRYVPEDGGQSTATLLAALDELDRYRAERSPA